MAVRILLVLLGLATIANGGFMLADPMAWYHAVPGVVATGPFNHHFISDIGLAYIASGIGFMLGARAGIRNAVFAIAGAAWPALHALLHIWGWLSNGFPADIQVALTEIVGVVVLAALGVVLAWLRARDYNTA